MILAIDIGNTTIRICVLTQNGGDSDVIFSRRTDTVRPDSPDGYRDMISSVLLSADIAPDSLEGAVICSVVPELTAPMRRCAKKLTGKPAVMILPDTVPLKIDLPEPCKVGADRLADAVWAAKRCVLPAVTADMGTATTFNVIGKDGAFLGGAICAGLDTGLKALVSRAAQLLPVELKKPSRAIGKNTEECMLSGAVLGTAAMIDGLTAKIENELGCPVSLVLTGGLAEYAEPFLSHPHICEPDLLPKGMAEVYFAAQKQTR